MTASHTTTVDSTPDAVGSSVLRNYLARCVTTAIEGIDPLIYEELMRSFSRYLCRLRMVAEPA